MILFQTLGLLFISNFQGHWQSLAFVSLTEKRFLFVEVCQLTLNQERRYIALVLNTRIGKSIEICQCQSLLALGVCIAVETKAVMFMLLVALLIKFAKDIVLCKTNGDRSRLLKKWLL
jgi:hypothetical protein